MIEGLTAAAIAKLVFDAVIQTGTGKLTEKAIEKGQQLWQKIRGKVKEEGVTEAILVEVEQQKSWEVLERQIVPFLQVSMIKDPNFKQDIQNIAQQFNQEINKESQDNISMNANAYDQSTVKQVGKIDANEVNF